MKFRPISGHGVRRRWRTATTALFAAFILVVLAACGGGDGGLTAKSLVPDLDDLQLEIAEEGRDPFAAPSQDTYRARYAATDGTPRAAIIVLFVEADTAMAEISYAALAKALESPPEEFFGAEAEQAEIEALPLADERRSFVTAQADSQGNRVWTDVYRKGRVITVIQVLAPQDSDHAALRQAVAEAVLNRVK